MRNLRLINDDAMSASPPAGIAVFAPRPPPGGPRSWRLKRNCALRPKQYLGAIGLLMAMSATVAIACWIRGIWLVPIFCCVELIGISVAALVYARHAVDGETVTLTEDHRVRIEVDRGVRHDDYVFRAQRLRLMHAERDERAELWLCDGAMFVKVGTYASPRARDMFEAELREALLEREI